MSRVWMPLYIKDYLADTAHLSNCESGAYLHLIMHYFLNGSLPTDDAALARIAKVSTRQWAVTRTKIEPFFGPDWKHERIEEEIKKSNEISEKRRQARAQVGKKSPTNVTTHVGQKSTHAHAQSQERVDNSNLPTEKPVVEEAAAPSASGGRYAFEAGVIKLNDRDLKAWKRAYQNINVEAELHGMARWAAEQPNWFSAVAGLLTKKERQAAENLAGIREKVRVHAELGTKPRRSLV